MYQVIAIVCPKGGVGKTTTAANLAAWLALSGRRVLAIDFDPQGSLSVSLGVQTGAGTKGLVLEDCPLEAVAVPCAVPQLSVVPALRWSGQDESLAQARLAQDSGMLRRAIDLMEAPYDFVIIDTPPSLGPLSRAALKAADSVIVPLQCEFLALNALPRLIEQIRDVRQELNRWLKLEGILVTMYDKGGSYAPQIVKEAVQRFSHLVFDAVIPRSTSLSEATFQGKPAPLVDRHSDGSRSYLALAQEILKRYPVVTSAIS